MSSSFKQKKLRTLATRKKTRKRKTAAGMTHEDESGRLFQPPSQRDPRWKKPDVSEIVEGVLRAKKKQRMSLLGGDDDDDEEDDEPEMVDPIESDDEAEAEEEEEQPLEVEEEEDSVEEETRAKTPVKLVASVEDAIATATKFHTALRRKDTRKKAKILILVDTESLFRGLKKSLYIKAETPRLKTKLGVRSGGDRKPDLSYKNIAPLKTPMDKFKESNEDTLKAFKIGKVVTLLAEDTSFYPYSDLALDYLILVAKSAQSAVNLDRVFLHDVQLHTVVVNDKGKSLSAQDRNQLADKFVIVE